MRISYPLIPVLTTYFSLVAAQNSVLIYNNIQIDVRASNPFNGARLAGYHVGAGLSYIVARSGSGSSFSFNLSATSAQLLNNDVAAGYQLPCYVINIPQISSNSGPLECGAGDQVGYYDNANTATPNGQSPGPITFVGISRWYACTVQSFTYGWIQGTIVGSFAGGTPFGDGIQNCTTIDSLAFVGVRAPASASSTSNTGFNFTTSSANSTTTIVRSISNFTSTIILPSTTNFTTVTGPIYTNGTVSTAGLTLSTGSSVTTRSAFNVTTGSVTSMSFSSQVSSVSTSITVSQSNGQSTVDLVLITPTQASSSQSLTMLTIVVSYNTPDPTFSYANGTRVSNSITSYITDPTSDGPTLSSSAEVLASNSSNPTPYPSGSALSNPMASFSTEPTTDKSVAPSTIRPSSGGTAISYSTTASLDNSATSFSIIWSTTGSPPSRSVTSDSTVPTISIPVAPPAIESSASNSIASYARSGTFGPVASYTGTASTSWGPKWISFTFIAAIVLL